MPPCLEIFLAAAIPIAVFAFLSGRIEALRGLRLVAVLATAFWIAPAVLTCSTTVALDFLGEESPHASLRRPGALTSNPLLNDVVLQFLPWREAVKRSLLSGEIPMLDRSAGGGTPLLANPQAGVFYLPNLVSLPLSTFAWPVFASVTKILIALAGMFLFLRRRDVSLAAANFGAIAYAFSTFTAAFLMFPHTNVTTLFPWLLLAIDAIVETGGPRSVATGAVVTSMLLAAGHPESAFHCALVAVPYALFRAAATRSRAALARLTATAVLAAALSAVALIPFVEYVPHTQRVHDIATIPGFLTTPPLERAAFVTLLVPDYYGNPRVHNYRHTLNFNELATQYAGLAALVLALVGAARRSSQRTFWVATGAIAFLLANQPPQIAPLLERLPLLDITAHGRMRFVFTFAIAVLAAFGLDDAVTRRRLRVSFAAFAGLAVIAICAVSYPQFAAVGIRRLVFFTEIAALASVAVLLLKPSPRSVAALTALLFLDLFSVCGLYNPAVGREWFYPQTAVTRALPRDARFVGIGRAVMPNSAVFFGAEDVRPHDPMAFRPFVAALDAAGFNRGHYFGRFDALPSRTFLDFTGVQRIATAPGVRLPLPLLHGGADGMLYANPTALPRFFEPRSVERASSAAFAFGATSDPHTVYSDSRSQAVPGGAAIVLQQRTANASIVKVTAPHDTFVASSEVALPGWELSRNDGPWAWERINGAFVGWRVPAGENVFELRYVAPGFYEGAVISLIALLVTMAMWRGKPAPPA